MKHILLSCILLCLLGCSYIHKPKSAIIRIKGSDTMFLLNSLWAEEYMKTHVGTAIYIEGGGTGTGTVALAKGEVDICAASRPLRPDEVKLLAKNSGTVGMSFLVAKDALSVYVNPDNPIHDFSMEQLKSIFTGKITNWNEIGWKDMPILLLSRPPNSGSYLYFKEHVLEGEPYNDAVKTLPTTASIIREVAKNKNAIGYGGVLYKSYIKPCEINGIKPNEENVINAAYPLTRYLYFYTVNTPRGMVTRFIDWVLGSDGQEIARMLGFFPIWE